MRIAAVVVLVLLIAAWALVVVLGRDRLARSRAARLLQVGRLTARLSTSWIGAALRQLFASRERRARIREEARHESGRRLAETMGQMKGVLMKLGQILSFAAEDLPPEMRAALEGLQSQAPPMDFALLRDALERDLGRPLERAFADFDVTPIAAASIGQVHRARLSSGEDVVVKIQYPGVDAAIRADLDNAAVLYRAVGLFYPKLDPKPAVAELRTRILEELDYEGERRHQERFATLYAAHPFIRVPHTFASHSGPHVLTQEFVAGRRFHDVLALPEEERARYGEILWRFVFGSIFRAGLFNADPHPGNYLFDAQGRMVFLDFGCTKRFPEPMLEDWRYLVRSHLEGDLPAFRARLVALGFIEQASSVETDRLYEYFGYFYAPIARDEDFTFRREYTAKSAKWMFQPEGRLAGLARQLNMPADFVFVNRLQWGVYSVLGQLGARANFHRIQREYLYGDPPATPLGRADAEHRAAFPAAPTAEPEAALG